MHFLIKILHISLLLGLLCFSYSKSIPYRVNIGSLFDDDDNDLKKVAFKDAVEQINMDPFLLPNTKLIPIIEVIRKHDSFYASKKVCDLIKFGVAAIFGPQSSETSIHIHSVCDALGIPHIETRWSQHSRKFLNLYPHPTILSQAYLDLIKYWKWNRFTIFYEDVEGLARLQELLKNPESDYFHITVRQLIGDDYRHILKEIRSRRESHIVLDCNNEKIYSVLKQAQQLGMVNEYYHYFIATLDFHTVDFEDFQYGGANISAFRILDLSLSHIQDILYRWIYKNKYYSIKNSHVVQKAIKTETALLYDAVYVFAEGLHQLDKSNLVNITSLDCSKDVSWKHGNSLINYMKLVELNGLTGIVKFNESGIRSEFSLDVVQLTRNGLEVIGKWSINARINMTKNYTSDYIEIVEKLENKTLIVTTILEPPYAMLKRSPESLSGNDRYEGFCIDLLKEISKILKFNYTIRPVMDGKYGANTSGEWNGMVRELMDKKSDLAVAPLTITYIREEVIDFTKPFMNLGISILFKKPGKKNPALFSFLSPLSTEVWIYMVTAYLGVSFTLFILARFSPYEWYNPHPCNQDSDITENQFSVLNSLWFTIGSLMQQGSEVAPKAISTRLASGIWWFFTLIMISSYTANLAAFLTVERMVSPIQNADDLAKQTEIKYGSLKAGSTTTFFNESKIPTYQRMWAFMDSAEPSVFVNSTNEGIARVKKGNYAYLMESVSIEYITERDCELTQIGGLLDSKGYGIGTPPNSPYNDPLSLAILMLEEKSVLIQLKDKWWKKKYGGGACNMDDKPKDKTNELSLANVGGVFVVLLGGLGIAIFVALVEFLWKTSQRAKKNKRSLISQFHEEFHFAFHGRESVKKAAEENNSHNSPDNTNRYLPRKKMSINK